MFILGLFEFTLTSLFLAFWKSGFSFLWCGVVQGDIALAGRSVWVLGAGVHMVVAYVDDSLNAHASGLVWQATSSSQRIIRAWACIYSCLHICSAGLDGMGLSVSSWLSGGTSSSIRGS